MSVQTTVVETQQSNDFIVGSWGSGYYSQGLSGSSEPEYISLVFYPNGYYIHYETGQLSEPCDNGGGAEYGTYTYDSTTETMMLYPIYDGNGCVGPADYGAANSSKAQLSGGTIIFDGTYTFARVESASSLIVGSWGNGYYPSGIENNGEPEFISLTFYPNGHYMHYETGQPSEDDNGGGAEIGTYSHDSVTNLLTIHAVITDGNGEVGLSEWGSIPAPSTAIGSGDTLDAVLIRVQ